MNELEKRLYLALLMTDLSCQEIDEHTMSLYNKVNDKEMTEDEAIDFINDLKK